jgi:hypothetical protein
MRHAQDNPVIALFGLYYLLVDTGALWARVKRHFPISDHLAEQLADRFVRVTDALVLESGVTAIVQGVVVGVGFEIVGLRPAILWGFVTACALVLPLSAARWCGYPARSCSSSTSDRAPRCSCCPVSSSFCRSKRRHQWVALIRAP